MQGEIVNWLDHRGFGFIRPDDGTADVFVHANDLPGGRTMLTVGTRVEFDVGTGRQPDKACAKRVRIAPNGGVLSED